MPTQNPELNEISLAQHNLIAAYSGVARLLRPENATLLTTAERDHLVRAYAFATSAVNSLNDFMQETK